MLKYLRHGWYLALLGALSMIGEVTVDLIQPRLMEQIVDYGILGLNSGGTPDMQLVFSTGIRMILIVLLGGICGVMGGVFVNLFAQNYGNAIRKDCFAKIMQYSFEQTDTYTAGSLITRMTNDVTQVQNMASQLVRGCVRSMMFLFAGSAALLSLDLHFTQILAIALPVILVEIAFIIRKTTPLFLKLQQRLDYMNGIIRENIGGIRVVKAFVQEDREEKHFDHANQDLSDTQFHVLLYISWLQPVINMVLNIAAVFVIKVGSVDVQSGMIMPGTVMAAVTYLTLLLNGLRMIALLFQTLSRGFTSSGRLKELLATEPSIESGNDASKNPSDEPSIVFSDVSFHYKGHDHNVLEHINWTVHPGETMAIIGATGCGKSTLVNLIPRFYDASEGSVRICGKDVRKWDLQALRSEVAFVLQKSEMFSGTIRDNIAMGRPGASEEEIRRAARASQAEEFILRQPDEYETTVTQGGTSLSGGQKQRVAIARALLKNAPILIFDDATSALDLKTEAALHQAVRKEYPGRTKIVIAQRIATVMRADRIAVMDSGRIIACDTHENLMKNCEIYKDIYRSQLKK